MYCFPEQIIVKEDKLKEEVVSGKNFQAGIFSSIFFLCIKDYLLEDAENQIEKLTLSSLSSYHINEFKNRNHYLEKDSVNLFFPWHSLLFHIHLQF